MSDGNSNTPVGGGKIDKKILENPFVGSLVVPIAIVLVGALVIFGVTKMISSEHSYKDLVREMQSKTFGNKWVAALELSKLISAKRIPEEDIPWLIDNLDQVYSNTIDFRTKDFVVVAAGALNDSRALKIIKKGLNEDNKDILFHSIVSLGNIKTIESFDWTKVISFLDSEDHALVQAAALVLSTHRVEGAREKLIDLSKNGEGYGIRYAAGTGLIYFKDEASLPVVSEILSLNKNSHNGSLGAEKIRALKINVINAIGKEQWSRLATLLDRMIQREEDLHTLGRAKEVKNLLNK